MSAPWYNNHTNLYTLAEWLREWRGWEFCKQNLLDVIERPWKWEKEWRLANGDVHFTEVLPEDGEVFDTNSTKCDWCDTPVGYVTFGDEDGWRVRSTSGTEVEWVTTYIDDNTNDLACDDCAGTAANFTETVGATVVAS